MPTAATSSSSRRPGAGVGGTRINTYTADPALRTAGVTRVWRFGWPYALPLRFRSSTASTFDLPDLSTPYVSGRVDSTRLRKPEALTPLAGDHGVINEFLTDTTINAAHRLGVLHADTPLQRGSWTTVPCRVRLADARFHAVRES